MKLLSTFLAAFCFALAAQAQTKTLATTAAAHEQSAKIVNQFLYSEFDEAFETLKQYWPLASYQIDGLKNTTAKQIPMLEEQYGKLLGAEFVRSETLGTFGHVEYFVLKYEKNALRVYLTYYNGGNGWLINSLQWDDRWDLLFSTTQEEKK